MSEPTAGFERAPAMYEPSAPSYQQCMESARLAVARDDRPGVRLALQGAIVAAERDSEGAGSLAGALTRLGEVSHQEGNEAEAESLFRRALQINEQILGPEHPDLVVLINDLSRLYLKRSAWELAEPLLLRLHAIKRHKGEEHPEVATVLASLAGVHQAMGRHDSAEQLWRRVLEIRERTLAPNHFALATALEHLGETCAARGKLAEALRLMQRALATRELTLDPGHASLRRGRERIADLQLQASEAGLDGEMGEATPAAPLWRPPPRTEPFTLPSSLVPDVPRTTAPSRQPGDWEPTPVQPRQVPDQEVPSREAVARDLPPRQAREPEPAPRQALERELPPRQALEREVPPPAHRQALERELPSPGPRPLPAAALQPAPPLPLEDEPSDDDPMRPDGADGAGLRLVTVGGPGEIQRSLIMPYYADAMALADEALIEEARAARRGTGLGSSMMMALRGRQGAVVAGIGATALVLGALGVKTMGGSPTDDLVLGDRAVVRQAPPPALSPVSGEAPAASPVSDSVSAGGSVSGDAAGATEADRRAGERARVAAERRAGAREPDRTAASAAAPDPALPRSVDIRVEPARTLTSQNGDAAATLTPSVSLPTGTRLGAAAARGESDGGSQPALLIVAPTPVYPASLYTRGVGGRASVEFVVDTTGRVITSSFKARADHESFAEAVQQIVPDMRFVPSTQGTRKVRTTVRMIFEFNRAGVTSSRAN